MAWKPLDISNILKEVSDESIWHFLLDVDFDVGISFSMRDEGIPSARITSYQDRLWLKDFGTLNKNQLPEHYLMQQGYTYLEALEVIRQAFSLNSIIPYHKEIEVPERLKNKPKIYPHKKYLTTQIDIQYRSRKWGSWEIDKTFWNLLSLDDFKIPKLFRVKPLDYYWIINGTGPIRFKVRRDSPTYLYLHKGRCKLYSPYEDKFKWISNTKKDDIFGLELLPPTGEVLVIESSLKDAMVAYMVGIPAIPGLNEMTFIPLDLFESLKKRFKHIIVHMNNDEPGKKANKHFEELYNIKSFYNPGGIEDKDNFAFMCNHGLKEFKEMYLNNINKLIQ